MHTVLGGASALEEKVQGIAQLFNCFAGQSHVSLRERKRVLEGEEACDWFE